MDIVLFGIQGSGKGTIARAVSTKFGFHYFETGAQLRKLSQEDSSLGHKVKAIIEEGKLVPNDIVMEIIEDFMNTVPKNEAAIFDGIPRKQIQAKTFDALMKKLDRSYMGILVNVPKEIAIKRITLRRICANCKAVYAADYERSSCEKCSGELISRSDDNPESIKMRFTAYFEETMPVIEEYKSKNMLLTIDGIPPIPEVRETTIKLIEEKLLK